MDFETHPRGTTTELQLSRELARAIEQEIQSYGNVVPHSVLAAYQRLNQYYQQQIEMGL